MEVITYGGGEHYRDVFQAVALMAGSGSMDSLLRLAMVIGLVIGMMKAITDFNIGRILKWFIMATVIWGVMWVPKVQVQVVDKFNAGLTGGAVANVPLGVGFTASTVSRIGDRVIQMTETSFGQPEDVRYSKTGMIYGAKVFERMRTFRITDPRFDQNMQSFVRGCIYYDVLSGYTPMGELANASDIWTYVTTTKPQNPGRSIEFLQADGSSPLVTCPQAAGYLDADWAAQIEAVKKMQEKRLRPQLSEGELAAASGSEVETLHSMVFGASKSSGEIFKQLLMANSVRRGMSAFAAEAGGSAMDVVAETQADIQTRNTQILLGSVAEKAIVVLKIVVDLLFIGMFPLLFPVFLLPGFGPKMLQGYLTGFFYLQLWGPMYVILHHIMMGRVRTDTAAAAYIPGSDLGLKLANIESIGSINADISAVAGAMTLMIPVLAGMLTKGAMAVGGAGESLIKQFSSGAEAAGAASSTGNYSVGNTAFENHSWNNLSANRHHISADVDKGNATFRDGNLNTHAFGGSGGYQLTTARSTPAVGFKMSEGVQSAATQQATKYRDMGQAVDKTWSEATSNARSDVVEIMNAWNEGREVRHTAGRENRASNTGFASDLTSLQSTIQRDFKLSEGDAKAITMKAGAEVFAEGSAGGGIGIASGKAGARGSAGFETSRGNLANTTAALDFARQELDGRQWGSRFEQLQSSYAQDTWSSHSGFNQQYREVSADTFTSSRTVQDSLRKFENEGRRWEERSDYARTSGASMEGDYAQEFIYFARDRLIGQSDSQGRIGEERFARIMEGADPTDRGLLDEVAESFFNMKAAQITPPTQIGETRDAASGVSALTPFGAGDLREAHRASPTVGTGPKGQVEAQLAGEQPAAFEFASTPWAGQRDGVKANVGRVDDVLDAATREKRFDGKVIGGAGNMAEQFRHPQGVHQETGAARRFGNTPPVMERGPRRN